MILLSMEVRWFGAGEAPQPLAAYFAENLPLVQAEAPREDVYLSPDPGWPHVGIKMREGRLEAKAQVHSGCDAELPGGLAARVRGWSKWSLDPELGRAALASAFEASAPTIRVAKARRLRRFAADGSVGSAAAVTATTMIDPTSAPDRGCTVELARLSVRRGKQVAREAWTFGFEAVGAELRDALGILSGTLNFVAADLDAEGWRVLQDARCESYPEWLAECYQPGHASTLERPGAPIPDVHQGPSS